MWSHAMDTHKVLWPVKRDLHLHNARLLGRLTITMGYSWCREGIQLRVQSVYPVWSWQTVCPQNRYHTHWQMHTEFELLYLYRHCLLPNTSKFDPLIYNLYLNLNLNLPLILTVKPSNTCAATLNISGRDLQELYVWTQMSESVGLDITLPAPRVPKSV